MIKANADLRLLIFQNNIKMYQIAEKMGIHYATLNAKLRKELTFDEKQNIVNIIDSIKKGEI